MSSVFSLRMLYLGSMLLLANLYTITGWAQLQAAFSVDQAQGCPPLLTQFTDNSTGGATTWQWTRNGNAFSALQNPSIVFNTAGSYTICLTVGNAAGQSDTKCETAYIQVFNPPVVDFSTTDTLGCLPLVVDYTPQVTPGDGAITGYQWDFGDGTAFSTATLPTHTYTLTGGFDVTLVVTDANGCTASSTRTNLIQAASPPNAAFTHQALTAPCQLPYRVAFTPQHTASGATYRWDFGDGNTSTRETPTHTYTVAGCYTPSLIITRYGCADTVQLGSCINVQNGLTVSGNIVNPIICNVADTVMFQSTTANAIAWQWDFGDGNTSSASAPKHVYEDPGIYEVRLRVFNNSGCQSEVVIGSVAVSSLTALFALRNNIGCVPQILEGNDISQSFFPVVSHAWDFTTGTSTQDSFTHAINDTIARDLQLIVQDSVGCIDTVACVSCIQLGRPMTVDFTVSNTLGCAEDTVIFTPILGSNSYTDLTWDYGGQGAGAGVNPAWYVYQDTGAMRVSLEVNDRGCLSRVVKPAVTTRLGAVALATFRVSCDTAFWVEFKDKSIDAHRIFWNFGDPTTLADTLHGDSNPFYQYPGPGRYIIKLKAFNDTTGCEYTFTDTLDLVIPTVNITHSNPVGCAPHVIHVQTTSVGIVDWRWPGVGRSLNKDFENPIVLYENMGVYPPFVANVEDVYGCKHTFKATDSIRIQGVLGTFDGGRPRTCVGQTDTVKVNTISIGGAVTYDWSIGGTLSEALVNYTSSGPMTYSVLLENAAGCKDTVTQEVEVVRMNPSFYTPDTLVCVGNAVQFVNQSVIDGATSFAGLYQSWDFGDGNTSTQSSPQHRYLQTGTYTVCLTLGLTDACDSTYCRTQYIRVERAEAQFTQDSIQSLCPPLEVNFTTQDTTLQSWYWSFGDGSVSSSPNPSHLYGEAGLYDVQLIVESQGGCKDTLLKQNLINVNGPSGQIQIQPLTGCQPLPVTFIGTAQNHQQYRWVFDDGASTVNITSASADTVSHTYQHAGAYLPALLLSDGLGCEVLIQSPDSVRVDSIQMDFTPIDTTLCSLDSAQWSYQVVSYSPVQRIEWHFPGGQPATSVDANPSVFYPTSGVYTVELIIENTHCIDTLRKTYNIQKTPPPIVSFGVEPKHAICAPALLTFSDSTQSTTPITQRAWDFGDGQTSTLPQPQHSYMLGGNYTVTLSVTTADGCTQEAQQVVQVQTGAIVDLGADTTLCIGDSIQLTTTYTSGIEWNALDGTYLQDSAQAAIWVQPTQTTAYELVVQDTSGCISRDTLEIIIQALPSPTTNNQMLCNGDSLQIQVGTFAQYTWSSSGPMSCTQCATPTVWPTQNTFYTVQVVDSIGCVSVLDSLEIQVQAAPTIDLPNDTTVCPNTAVLWTAQVQPVAAQVEWNRQRLGLNTYTGLQVQAQTNQTTTYIATATHPNGCTNSDSVTLHVIQEALNVLGNDIWTCVGDSVKLQVLEGTQPQWQGSGLSCLSCVSPSVLVTDSSQYIVTVRSDSNCVYRDSLWVRGIQADAVLQTIDQTLCLGSSVLLAAEPSNGTFKWSPSQGLPNDTAAQLLVTPSQTTTFYLEATFATCQLQDSVQITVATAAQAQPLVLEGCLGDTVALEASGLANAFDWFDDTGNPLDSTWVINGMTQLQLIARLSPCPSDTIAVPVIQWPQPSATLPTSFTAYPNERIPLELTNVNNYQSVRWIPNINLSCDDCLLPTWTAQQDTTYRIELRSPEGCVETLYTHVRVRENCQDEAIVQMPTVFTPNNDGANDYYRPVTSLPIQGFEIYNRFGRLLYNDAEASWDGRFNGTLQPRDVYICVITYESPCDGRIKKVRYEFLLLE